ncbi:MAG TPA: hypothetical protein PLI95_09960 [Polyangiaceae bacterium]|nr:hypothetical protein [Polyangiaceae bacterium]
MRWRAWGIALGAAVVGACSVAPRSGAQPPWTHGDACEPAEPAPSIDVGIVLIALDGVREREVFVGVDPSLARRNGLASHRIVEADRLLPNLRSLVRERGFLIGGPGPVPMVVSSRCHCSLPGYMEMFSGRTPSWCDHNACGRMVRATIADELRASGWTFEDVAVVSSWQAISKAATRDPSSIALSAGRRHVEHAAQIAMVAASVGVGLQGQDGCGWSAQGYRADAETAQVALELYARHRPRFLFVGLGDTDEYAHAGDYGSYLDALRGADVLVGRMAELTQAAEGRATVIIVTTDHGRANNFRDHGASTVESGRGWLAGIGARVARALPGTVRRLADIAPTVRALVGLRQDTDREAGCALPLQVVRGEREEAAAR